MAAAATAAANLRRSLFCGIETVMAIDISIYVWVSCRAGRHCKEAPPFINGILHIRVFDFRCIFCLCFVFKHINENAFYLLYCRRRVDPITSNPTQLLFFACITDKGYFPCVAQTRCNLNNIIIKIYTRTIIK